MARWRCGLTRANRRTIAALIAASALLLALVSGDAQVSPSAAPPVAIEVRSEPITAFDVRDPSLRQFGLLEFRGGLVLRSSSEHFGGISAIRVAPDGAHFIALTDKGWWFRGRIVYEGTRPTGIADAEMAPILGADGRRWRRAVGMTRNRSRKTAARSMWASNASIRSSASITARRAFSPAAGRSRCRRDCARCPPTGGSRPWCSFRRVCPLPAR